MSKFSFLAVFFLFISIQYADSQQLTVGLYDNPPHMFVGKQGKPEGIFIEILELIAKKENLTIQYRVGTAEECYVWLDKGLIDILAESGLSEIHMKKYEMSDETVVSIWAQVYASSSSSFTTILELDEKKVAVLRDSYFVVGPNTGLNRLAEDLDIHPNLIYADSQEEVLQMVVAGQADAGVVNRVFGEININEYSIQATPIVFSPFRLTYAYPKQSTFSVELKPIIDGHLKELKANKNSEYYTIIDKYLGRDRPFDLPRWVWAAILFVLLQMLFYIYVLRKQVARRTKGLKKAFGEIKEREYILSTIYDNAADFMALLEVVNSNTFRSIKIPEWYLKKMSAENPDYPPYKILGMDWWDIGRKVERADEEELELRFSRIMSVMKSGKTLNYEEIKKIDGENAQLFESSLIPIYKGRKIKYLLYVTRNVTEQRAASEALKKSEEKMRLAVQNVPVMLDAFDQEQNLVVWNKKSEEITGYSADEMIGNPEAMKMLYPNDEYRAELSKRWDNDSLDYQDQTEIRCKNGEKKIIKWTHEADINPVPGWHDWGIGIDITEQIKAETALISSEKRLSNLISNFPGMVYRLDPTKDFLVVFLSDGSRDIFNISSTEFIEKGLSPWDFILKDYQDISRQAYTKAVNQYKSDELVVPVSIDGEIKWLLERFRAIDDENGNIVLDGVLLDITDRIKAQQKLEISQQQIQSLLDNIPGMAYRLKMEDGFRMVFVSEGSKELLGLTAREVLDKEIRPRDLILPAYHDFVKEETLKGIEERKLKEIVIPIKVNGKVKWVLNRFRPVEVGDEILLDGLFIDITDKIENEQRLQMALEGAREGLWDYYIPNDKLIFNDHMSKIIGYEPHEVDHTGDFFFQMMNPEHKDNTYKAMMSHLKGETEYYEAEYQLMTKSGEYKWIETRGQVVERDEQGKALRAIGTHIDINDRKKAELTLIKNEKLLRVLMSNLPGMVYRCECDPASKVDFVSDGAYELTGYTVEEFESGEIHFNQLIEKLERKKLWEQAIEAVSIGKSFTFVYRLRRKDGSLIWVWDSGSGLENNMLQGFITDITDRVESEERIIATMIETEDVERKRIAKELHDSLGQKLTTVSLNFNSLRKDVGADEKILKKLETGLKYLTAAIKDSRDIAHNLMPQSIEDFGYVLSVQSMLADIESVSPINFEFYDNLKGERIPENLEMHLYRITQEGVNNIIKYAKANQVIIQLMKYEYELILTIEDDGGGFDVIKAQSGEGGFGLKGMKNRVVSLGGEFNIDSFPGRGSIVTIEIPIKFVET